MYENYCLILVNNHHSTIYLMKNILIFAALAGIASAIAIYFVTEVNKIEDDSVAVE